MLFPMRNSKHVRPAGVRLKCELLEDRQVPTVYSIIGSSNGDLFNLSGQGAGVLVTWNLANGFSGSSTIAANDSVEVYGMGGDDDFFVADYLPMNIPITINGGADRDEVTTLGGTDRRWEITGGNSGTLSPSLTFHSFEDLRGDSTGHEQFVMHPTGSISHSIHGGNNNHLSVLDYSLWTAGVTVDLVTRTGPGIASVDGTTGILSVHAVIGGSAADTIIGAAGTNILRGGPGNDSLYGRGGEDVLIGGDGDDSLFGEGNRDLLIGGRSSGHFIAWGVGDRLDGGNKDDILIGGYTTYDAYTRAADLALVDLIDAWKNPVATYDARVQSLRAGVGGSLAALNASTVFDDRGKDTLTGGPDRDWFHTEPPLLFFLNRNPILIPFDVLADLAGDEFVD